MQSRLTTHIIRIGIYVSVVFWLAFVWGAIKVLSDTESGRHSRLVAWMILSVAVALMITAINQWIRYLSVIVGGGTVGSILATGTGHLLNGRPFPRLIAAGLTALFIGCGLILRSTSKRELTKLDKVAALGFVVALIFGMLKETPMAGLICVSVGFVGLCLAWLRGRFLSPQQRKSTNESL